VCIPGATCEQSESIECAHDAQSEPSVITSCVMVTVLRRWIGLSLVCLAASAQTARADETRSSPPAAQPAAYVDPPPVRIYRFHVYSTMKSRWKKRVMIDSLVSTSAGGVVVGDRGLLERKVDPSPDALDWTPVAKVVVKRLLPKGCLEVEIESEEAEAKVKRAGKLPYAPGQKVRLQIDRVTNATG